MDSTLNWQKRLIRGREASGVIKLGSSESAPAPTSRNWKSPFGGVIERAVAASAEEPGDIVEVDDHGAARVVGRRPRVAGAPSDISEQAIRARLRAIYGDEASRLGDVKAGANVVVFRRLNSSS
ncbi:hypothetical protein [Paraburkholderia fungorum]|uniref:hypothetical protein n=1 Tax=Paraburkholderia fungorum TaxID=134537 RepID=UPI0011AEA4C4|nr:hypothetical protein [Paraburkholderia fungorum]MBB5546658.1 hypothetical protein [Paraburkholderia fungorum]